MFELVSQSSDESKHGGTDMDVMLMTSIVASDDVTPPRRLNFRDGIGVTVGIIIGSGIFSSPGVALERAGSPGAALIAWVVAGGLVLCTSMCYIELGCMFPTAGGDFKYLTQAYGDRVAFSFAWFNFFISKPGSQAIIGTIFGRYICTVITGRNTISRPSSETELVTGLAVLMICFLTLINCLGIRESAIVQNVLTVCKLCLVLSLFLIAVVYSMYSKEEISENLSISSSFESTHGILSFGSALVACLWSFDGWADLNYLMEDLQQPVTTLPRVVFTGLTVVIVAYTLANIAYFCILSRETIDSSSAIAYEVGLKVTRSTGIPYLPQLLALGVALSTLGAANGSIMTGGRAFYAVARDGKAPAIFAHIGATGAPWPALLAQASISILLLVMPGSSYGSLLSYFGPASWFYYALTSSAVVVLRRRIPNAPRPFSVPWYPYPVLVVIVIATVIIVGSARQDPTYTFLAFGFLAMSIPVHLGMEYFWS